MQLMSILSQEQQRELRHKWNHIFFTYCQSQHHVVFEGKFIHYQYMNNMFQNYLTFWSQEYKHPRKKAKEIGRVTLESHCIHQYCKYWHSHIQSLKSGIYLSMLRKESTDYSTAWQFYSPAWNYYACINIKNFSQY